tara:strand:- start:281 stop:469 length:189 start_codon:yes stop_codon:yes gene_type:complete
MHFCLELFDWVANGSRFQRLRVRHGFSLAVKLIINFFFVYFNGKILEWFSQNMIAYNRIDFV